MQAILLSGSSAVASAVLCMSVAHAQQPTSPGATTPVEAGAAQPGGLEEIVVTAQRRAENLQRAAVAVTAVTGDALLASGVSETANLSKLVPSLSIAPSGGPGVSIFIRGVGTLQSNAYAENPIAFNFNGVYVARPTAPVGSFYDLERIEVMKGPQGTLYGRNATGGAINVLPKRPELGAFGGDLSLEYGNYDTKKVQGALNVPLGDQAALRLAAQIVERDGYLSDGYDDEVGQAVRASLRVEPSNRFSMNVVADYYHQGGNGLGSVLVPGPVIPEAPPLSSRIGGSDARSIAALTAFGASHPPFNLLLATGLLRPPQGDGFNNSYYYGLSVQADADLGFGTLTVLPAWRRNDVRYRMYLPGLFGDVREVSEQSSMEVRLASNGEQRLKYVVGAYYFHEDQNAVNRFSPGDIAPLIFTPELKTDSWAVFGQATFSVTDSFRLVAGTRYTDEKRSQVTALGIGGPANPNPVPGAPFSGKLNFNKVTWKGGVEWDAGPQSLVYASVATGFKAGGFFTAVPPDNTFAPEELTAYTIGSKNRFLNNRLQINLEVFYWEYKNQQISIVAGVDTPNGIAIGGVTRNAGRARQYGAEVELKFAPTPRDTFTADVQYLNGKYKTLAFTAISPVPAPGRTGCDVANVRPANPGAGDPSTLYDVDCSGHPTINSPKWTANIGYQHRFDIGGDMELVFGANSRIESGRELTTDYLPETHQKGSTTSDAYLTLEGSDDRWSLTGFVNNIEDRTMKVTAILHPVLPVVYAPLRPPRTYGVRVSLRF